MLNRSRFIRVMLVAGMVALAGCGGKLTTAEVNQLLSQVDEASQNRDADAMDKVLAPQLKVEVDMSVVGMGQALQLDKTQYMTLLQAGWALTGSGYKYERSGTNISLLSGGKMAQVKATVKETVEMQGMRSTSTMDQTSTIELVNGKPMVTRVMVVALSMK